MTLLLLLLPSLFGQLEEIPFSHQLKAVRDMKTSLVGYVRWDDYSDPPKRWVIRPKFGMGTPFYGRVAAAQETSSRIIGGKWGFINERGNWIVKPRYDFAESFDTRGGQLLCFVTLGKKKFFVDRWGIPHKDPLQLR